MRRPPVTVWLCPSHSSPYCLRTTRTRGTACIMCEAWDQHHNELLLALGRIGVTFDAVRAAMLELTVAIGHAGTVMQRVMPPTSDGESQGDDGARPVSDDDP